MQREASKRPEYEGKDGIVNKGYVKLNDTEPTVAVKWVRRPNGPHEVKYHHFLPGHQQTFWAEGNQRNAIVYPWCKGDALIEYKKDSLLDISFIDRVASLTTFLSDMNILHSKLRIHNDIKPANAVLHSPLRKMEMIDFGSARKVKKSAEFLDDLYEVHRLIKSLFPELEKTKEPSLLKTAMQLLLDAINPKDKFKDSCTSEQAWQYCEAIVANEMSLTPESLNEIADKTIFRKTLILEDVIRGRRLV